MIEYSEKYTKIGQEIINTMDDLEPIRESGANIGFLASSEKKRKSGKAVYADCRVIKKPWEKMFIPHDFLITVYEYHAMDLTDEQLNVLIWHELKHVGIKEKDGADYSFFIIPHDTEDFAEVLDTAGVHWNTEGAKVPDILGGESNG